MRRLENTPGSQGRRRKRRGVLTAINSNWLLVAGFAAITAVGTVLLRLPLSSTDGHGLHWVDAFFTSSSAVSVTGLTVVNTANELSLFGQVVVLLLMQVGGVGFIAFSVLLFRLIGRRVTLEERSLAQQSLGGGEAGGSIRLTLYVLLVTIGLEGLGALLLFARWSQTLPAKSAAYYAIFHAISAYCNAGFDLFSGTDRGVFFGYGADPYSLAVMAVLIIVGGFGITVVYDLWSFRRSRSLSLHTKLTLVMTVALIGFGALFLAADENLLGSMLAGMPVGRQAAVTIFTVVSARTAGLTIVPLARLTESSQLLLMISMFIGGGPASMAGGVSTSTVAVIAVAVAASIQGETEANAFKRTIPTETVYKAISVMTISTLLVALSTLVLVDMGTGRVFPVAFETVSAFSNTGYSLGTTADLSGLGRVLIGLVMFWGRLGPLTIVVALAQRSQPTMVGYPEEPVILG